MHNIILHCIRYLILKSKRLYFILLVTFVTMRVNQGIIKIFTFFMYFILLLQGND